MEMTGNERGMLVAIGIFYLRSRHRSTGGGLYQFMVAW
jgi:hypothetical protein